MFLDKIDQFVRFVICCRLELHPYNIYVSIIEPGAHTTNFLDSVKNNVTRAWDQLPSDTKDKFGEEYLHKSQLSPNLTFIYDVIIICDFMSIYFFEFH